ncbi:hypothetical protein ACFQ05_26600 [Amycolatopsis umgeniensis]|uniref:Uncharacterized protein n=1 Tax=Amycolatopsis umgeniensis TaxID=336628 RepID=A0A841BC88_9PSEU|nr:hypothetical protein [Amycolatopsis umgeniensis]MBB5856453.1 hypothetical protein [Amycolatopsis umgeniensis]
MFDKVIRHGSPVRTPTAKRCAVSFHPRFPSPLDEVNPDAIRGRLSAEEDDPDGCPRSPAASVP